MPWIKVIPEHEAEGELKEIYRKISEQRQGKQISRDRTSSAGGPAGEPADVHSLNPSP